MSYFIYEGIVKLNQVITLSGEEASHLIKSRRINIGETIEIQDNDYHRFQTKVQSVSKRSLDLLPLVNIATPPPSPFKINLYQALIKDKNIDTILQKCTELGVESIHLFQSAYSHRLKKDSDKQLQRWNKICQEACKQSGRAKPPQVTFVESFNDIIKNLEIMRSVVPSLCLATAGPSQILDEISFPENEVNLLIGPEGGWNQDESENSQIISVNLGARILRAETAAITIVGIMQYLHGDLHPL